MPQLRNSTVALQLSPVPSTLMTFPMPKRVCSMVSPAMSGEAGAGDGDGDEGDVVEYRRDSELLGASEYRGDSEYRGVSEYRGE